MKTLSWFRSAGASSRRVSVVIIALLAIGATSTLSQAAPKKPPPPPPIPKDIDPLTGFAELPHWPIGFIPPCLEASAKPSREGKYRGLVLAWIPPKAKRLRSVFIIPNNTDSKHIGEHKPIKKVAEKHEMAIIYLRGGGKAEKPVSGIVAVAPDKKYKPPEGVPVVALEKDKIPPIKPVADVPEAERKNYFWVADKEQAQAWFKVHTAKIHKQKFPGP